MNKYFIVILFIFLDTFIKGNPFVSSELSTIYSTINKGSISFKFEKDIPNNIMKVYLFNEVMCLDSTNIYGVDFSFDSITPKGDGYHYIYKRIDNYPEYFVEGELKGFYKQVLIQEVNQKIQFSYVGDYHYSYPDADRDSLGIYRRKDFRLYFDNSMKITHVKMYQFYKDYNIGNSLIDSSSSVDYLEYNQRLGVYYTSKQTLNGEFYIGSDNDNEKLILIENEEFFTLEVGKIVYLFYKKRWYRALDTKPITLREWR